MVGDTNSRQMARLRTRRKKFTLPVDDFHNIFLLGVGDTVVGKRHGAKDPAATLLGEQGSWWKEQNTPPWCDQTG
jgi:hypothetical protein